ncbi:PEP-CTERM sorting domain-containing protein [Noviherbaspirillum sp. UKPF54]|uniref:PEP-CTERM sorting domain-containing protein n=1 Tax=Noviherbaspirillum sp. UKPF54 TaxID=2601898 RepID=UPI0011B129F8|nr:PEP-CTERM sorting domain-containing protein [Noviherbaspirillum sp. UKPF54]QDZ29390.1 PEP-CTERM sorting domain-containing protein [Noviherbaspirillum sp. UKPF54]
MKSATLLGLGALALALSGSAMAAPFINGGFEDGNTNGWVTGGADRGGISNTSLNPDNALPGGSLYTGDSTRSAIIGAGSVDPVLGSLLGSTVYSGNYSYRIEDTRSGGYASAISQHVQNYTDGSIFFAWKAVLENGGHDESESALFKVVLRDDTTDTVLISRDYDAGLTGGGVDSRFSSSGDLFYTPLWQIEQLTIDAALSGHDFTLSLLAADCEWSGHTGYAYLDGFGAVLPPSGRVPLPGTLALMSLGLAGLGAMRKRRQP